MTKKKSRLAIPEKILSLSLAALSVICFFSLSALILLTKLNELPDLAKLLPENTTLGFMVLSVPNYAKAAESLPDTSQISTPQMKAKIQDFVGFDLENLDWFTGDFGVALTKKDFVYFLSTRSKKAATEYFQNTDFNFEFFGRIVAVSSSEEALQELKSVKKGEIKPISSTSNYINVEGRLPRIHSAFFYFNLQNAESSLSNRFETIPQPIFSSVLQIFPDLAGTIEFGQDEWYMESFLAVDKSNYEGGILRNTDKYQALALSTAPDGYKLVIGGQNLPQDLERIHDVLMQLDPAMATAFKYNYQSKDMPKEEYWYGWNSSEDQQLLFVTDQSAAPPENRIFDGAEKYSSIKTDIGTLESTYKIFDDGIYSRNYFTPAK
ncbi:hypothetical protein KKC94_02380 [Patescibacteria group bacterium]|nr:hypothetical protein [Patescibacteria group bacterium]